MIKAHKLFLVPALTAFLWLLPLGFLLWFFIIIHWYNKNTKDIHAYFRGYEYEKEEYANIETLV